MKKYVAPMLETESLENMRNIIMLSSEEEGEGVVWTWERPKIK